MEAVETLPLVQKTEIARAIQESSANKNSRLKEIALYIGGGIVGAGIFAGSIVAVRHGVHTQDVVDQLKACSTGGKKPAICQGLSNHVISETIQSKGSAAAVDVLTGSIAGGLDVLFAMTVVAAVRSEDVDTTQVMNEFKSTPNKPIKIGSTIQYKLDGKGRGPLLMVVEKRGKKIVGVHDMHASNQMVMELNPANCKFITLI
jgi:hypothetical protein